ncbi:MAG: hypothetical protein KJ799_10420 [Bacteroidetes bacterium]|nr:hypothetical protein [Bacteroidota bacterium]MBU2507122.1 hypothetical protein [Bacteroidota bacterium]
MRLLSVISLLILVGCSNSVEPLENIQTTVYFSLAETSDVEFYLENTYNTKVFSVSTKLPAGTHSIDLPVDDLVEGIYFYTLVVKGVDGNNYQITKKVYFRNA